MNVKDQRIMTAQCVWKCYKNVVGYDYNIGLFPINNMQTAPSPFRNGPIYMKDAQYAETNEK